MKGIKMSDEKNIKKIDDPFCLLEQIKNIGQKSKNIPISDGFTIKIQTLSSEDEIALFANSAKYDGSEYFTRHKIETIVYSIIEINKKSLREYNTIEDEKERMELKTKTIDKIRLIVSKWNDNLISFVYGEYSKIIDESENELIKFGILEEIKTKKTEEK